MTSGCRVFGYRDGAAGVRFSAHLDRYVDLMALTNINKLWCILEGGSTQHFCRMPSIFEPHTFNSLIFIINPL